MKRVQMAAFWALLFSIAILSTGLFLNQRAVSLNGGVMPVVAKSDAERAIVLRTIAEEKKMGAVQHSLATTTTKLLWAADSIRLYSRDLDTSGNIVESDDFFSLGDILLFIGLRGTSVALVVCLVVTFVIFATKGLGIAKITG